VASPVDSLLEAPKGLFGALSILALGCLALTMLVLAATAEAFDRWSNVAHLDCCDSQSFIQVALLATLTAIGASIAATAARAAAACSSAPLPGPTLLLGRLRTLAVTATIGAGFTIAAIMAALLH
jgi:hypothetical protein